ncbi:MAG: GyrI-like domain-containing protein [Myxococcota bacterium]|nr:GyrI-like domain-containing protein [Myxococcota bacterium]
MSQEIQHVQLPPQHYIGLRRSVPVTELQPFFAEALPRTFGWLAAQGIAPLSAPVAVWRAMDMETGIADVHAGAFVAEPPPQALLSEAGLSAGSTEAAEGLKLVHTGPYSKMGASWQRVFKHAASLGRAPGAGWEVYLDDPTETEESALRTEIYLPLSPK